MPEIWQKRAELEGYAKLLNSKATQLAATARTGNAQATHAAIADLGRTTSAPATTRSVGRSSSNRRRDPNSGMTTRRVHRCDGTVRAPAACT